MSTQQKFVSLALPLGGEEPKMLSKCPKAKELKTSRKDRYML